MESSKKNEDMAKAKENGVNLKVFCMPPQIEQVREQHTSYYEIDIESGLEFLGEGKRKTKMIPVGESVAMIAVKDSGTERKKKGKGDKDYQELLDTHEIHFETGEVLLNAGKINMQENNRQNLIEKADKENQSSHSQGFEEFRKNLRKYLRSHFEKNTELKGLLEGYEELDGRGLHIHHHEHHHHHHHHHHHYDENLQQREVNRLPDSIRKECGKFSGRKRIPENQKLRNAYVCQSSNTSNMTFTMSNQRHKKEELMDWSMFLQGSTSRSRPSTSNESLSVKKSNFINSHTYSDTDLNKIESEEEVGHEPDPKTSRITSQSSYGEVIQSLKSLNNFTSPVVITNQEQVPKFSYITCECVSVGTADSSSGSLVRDPAAELKIQTIETERPLENEEDSTKDTDTSQENKNFSRQVHFDIWNTRVMEELKQIKKELKRLEEGHLRKKKICVLQSGPDRQQQRDNSGQGVAVYSSRTFILTPENVCLVRRGPQSEGNSERHLEKHRLTCGEGELSSPGLEGVPSEEAKVPTDCAKNFREAPDRILA